MTGGDTKKVAERLRGSKNLFCPGCGERLSHLQPYTLEKLTDREPECYGFDCYCESCG